MSTAAIVLCGGQSRRMGQPKAWLRFGPEYLLQRVVRRLLDAVESVVVVAAPGQELPALPGSVDVARDPVLGRGPLQGLAAGLAALPAGVELAFLTATDVPFVVPGWIEALEGLIGDADLAIPMHDDHLQPMAALYRRTPVLVAATKLLAADRLRPVFLCEEVRTVVVPSGDLRVVDPTFATLRNLNTPEDYQQALRDAGLTRSDEDES